MRIRFWVPLMLGLFLTVGCSSSDEEVPEPPPPEEPIAEEVPIEGMSEEGVPADEAAVEEMDISPVHFSYDEFVLNDEAKGNLEFKAKYLSSHPDVKLQIEGHCDERGSNQYNLALGDKRANATKDYLVMLGVPVEQLTTISYGEEKPAVAESNEDAWAKNRRSEFLRLQ